MKCGRVSFYLFIIIMIFIYASNAQRVWASDDKQLRQLGLELRKYLGEHDRLSRVGRADPQKKIEVLSKIVEILGKFKKKYEEFPQKGILDKIEKRVKMYTMERDELILKYQWHKR